MYFTNEPQASTHAVSKPIDILRSQSNESNNRYGYQTSNEKPVRPVNRELKTKTYAQHDALMGLNINNSISSNSSTSSQQQAHNQNDEVSNKENCNRLPTIYNLYANTASNDTMPVDAMTRNLFSYISVSPSCSCTDYFSDEDERVSDDSDILMPTEFRSIGDIIGYANVIKSQRQQTMDRFNSTMNHFSNAWSTLRREMQTRNLMNQNTQMQ